MPRQVCYAAYAPELEQHDFNTYNNGTECAAACMLPSPPLRAAPLRLVLRAPLIDPIHSDQFFMPAN